MQLKDSVMMTQTISFLCENIDIIRPFYGKSKLKLICCERFTFIDNIGNVLVAININLVPEVETTGHNDMLLNPQTFPGPRKRCKTAKTGVFRRPFTSVRNTTKIGGENGGRFLAKKPLVKWVDVLR